MKHITSMREIERETIERFFRRSEVLLNTEQNKSTQILHNKKLGLIFFQASTRTRLSFETAMLNLGGKNLGFCDVKTTRSGDFFKETLEDAVRVVGQMVDCIIIRHFESNSIERMKKFSPVPLINGGDGSNEHPTQALTDLWTIHRYLGGLDGKCIGLVGSPSTRVMRSLLIGLSQFKIKEILFLLPFKMDLPDETNVLLSNSHIQWKICHDIIDLLEKADVIEMHPINIPDLNRATDMIELKNIPVPDCYRITKEKIESVGRCVPILHPGPRLDEMPPTLDDLPQFLYFQQVRNSIFMRMTLLDELINNNKKS